MTEKPEAAIIAKIIKDAREAKGWTRYELAKRADIGETHLAKIEEGEYCIRVDVVNKLAKALDITISFPVN